MGRNRRHHPELESPSTPTPRWWSWGRLAVLAVVVVALTFAGVRVVSEFRTPPPPSRCTLMVAAMPPRARLAQRLMIGVDGSNPDNAISVIAAEHVGGVFIGGKATALLRGGALGRAQAAGGGLPVAIAVDDEGGRVQRIDTLDGSIPSARIMAATMNLAQVRALAGQRGRELRARGVTIDIAPVADVSDQPSGSVIGDRSFSDDPQRVAQYADAFAAGLRDGGVLPVFKHFPGHGHGTGDSHRGKVSTPPLAALRTDDLLPYRTLLSSGPAAVMVGHLDVPGLTGGQPATLSATTYQLLRGEMGFSGLVLTDDLGAMRAISNQHDLPDAVLDALQAGADMALWTSSARVDEVLTRLEAAQASGRLPGSDESVARVLAAKGAC
jgi:beta-N-acetylhexosaminidase